MRARVAAVALSAARYAVLIYIAQAGAGIAAGMAYAVRLTLR